MHEEPRPALLKRQLTLAIHQLIFEDPNSAEVQNLISHEAPGKMAAIQIAVFDTRHLKPNSGKKAF